MRCIMYVAFVVLMSFAPSVALTVATQNVVEPLSQVPTGPNSSYSSPTILKTSGEKMCLLGAAVPEFYMLGTQKAGSTTLAMDMFRLGFKSAIDPLKELHTFDSHCNYRKDSERTKREYMPYGASMDVCKKMTDSEKEAWTHPFSRCESKPVTALTDFTPANLRLPGLPGLMADLYGEKKSQLTFGIMVREPVSRFQSGWYYAGGPTAYNTTFREHVDSVLSMAENMDDEGIGQEYFLDQFYRSLYSTNMKHWFDEFKPEQFIIIPSGLYLKNETFKASLMQDIGRKMSMEVNTSRLEAKPLRHPLEGSHPPLIEDLDSSQIATLRAKHYDPAINELSQMLAEAIPDGLTLSGFEGRPIPSDIEAFLRSSW
mmetsp:Transcript_95521/g.204989  ORF Transcript_95521/g.204989 Transcript_95521/m.204989 type:complete len:371 (+) Transcript_95521:110-1222(+)